MVNDDKNRTMHSGGRSFGMIERSLEGREKGVTAITGVDDGQGWDAGQDMRPMVRRLVSELARGIVSGTLG